MSQVLKNWWMFKLFYILFFLNPSFLKLFLLSGTIFEGGSVDVFTMIKHIDYPRDSETRNIAAAIHPQLQVSKQPVIIFYFC